MAKICPMYLCGITNGIYYYAAYQCPNPSTPSQMASSTPLQTGCNSPHCQTTYSESDSRLVAGTEYVGFPGDPCLLCGLDPCMGWPEAQGITEQIKAHDCRFKLPADKKVPGAGEIICARLFNVRWRVANGKFVELRVGQEIHNHPNAEHEAKFPLDEAQVTYVARPFLFMVTYQGQSYSVLTRHRT